MIQPDPPPIDRALVLRCHRRADGWLALEMGRYLTNTDNASVAIAAGLFARYYVPSKRDIDSKGYLKKESVARVPWQWVAMWTEEQTSQLVELFEIRLSMLLEDIEEHITSDWNGSSHRQGSFLQLLKDADEVESFRAVIQESGAFYPVAQLEKLERLGRQLVSREAVTPEIKEDPHLNAAAGVSTSFWWVAPVLTPEEKQMDIDQALAYMDQEILLKAEFIDGKKSITEIAGVLGVSTQYVSKKWDMEALKKHRTARYNERIKHLLDNGKDLEEIRITLGVSKSKMFDLLTDLSRSMSA